MIQIEQFIVVDGDSLFRNGRSIVSTTVAGSVLYPLESPIPVISRGKGCLGVGVIKELKITAETTTIKMQISEVSEQAAKAYYDLYRNKLTMSTDTEVDHFDNPDDVIIPGAMSLNKPKKKASNRSDTSDYGRRTRENNSSRWGNASMYGIDDMYDD